VCEVREGGYGPADLLWTSDEEGLSRLGRLVSLGLAAWLAGCASGPLAPPPASSLGPPPPDLRGTWTGTWGGAPLTLVVTDQTELGAPSGLYFGSTLVLGQRAPGVSGVITSTIAGQPLSASVNGWLGSSGAAVTLLLQARTLHGTLQLTLTRLPADRLVGRGESDFPWGPRGDVELSRRPAT
jgi:hypothetical protein